MKWVTVLEKVSFENTGLGNFIGKFYNSKKKKKQQKKATDNSNPAKPFKRV